MRMVAQRNGKDIPDNLPRIENPETFSFRTTLIIGWTFWKSLTPPMHSYFLEKYDIKVRTDAVYPQFRFLFIDEGV